MLRRVDKEEYETNDPALYSPKSFAHQPVEPGGCIPDPRLFFLGSVQTGCRDPLINTLG